MSEDQVGFRCPCPRRLPRRRTAGLAFLLSLTIPAVAEAHPSGLRAGDAWWQAWHFDPLVASTLLLLLMLYGWGLRRVWGRAGVGRGVARWQGAAFGGGLLAVLLALMSPLDTLSEDLSWVHMTQHMVLMVIAAPLMILGAPGLVTIWAVSPHWRKAAAGWTRRGTPTRELWNFSWNPLFIWSLHAVILWGWHLPILYQWALDDPLVHDIEHLSFFLVACLFWRIAIDRRTGRRLNPGLTVLYLFTTSLHATLLGVFMALSPQPWYPTYVGRTELWGLSPLEDQQLAGLIMWMPACMVYAVAAAGVFAAWLTELERPAPAQPGGVTKHLPSKTVLAGSDTP